MSRRLIPGLRVIRARPRLSLSAAAGVLVWWLLPRGAIPLAVTRLLVAWDAGALLYLTLALAMMARSSAQKMRSRACAQDEGQSMVLTLVVCSALATLIAIGAELATAKSLQGWPKAGHIALAGLTVLTTWWVTQVMFALHYAHGYYKQPDRGPRGFDFPGESAPDYFDFLYAATIIGTSAQTGDVAFNTRPMRRLGLVHSALAFFFNTFLLALTINVAAGLF